MSRALVRARAVTRTFTALREHGAELDSQVTAALSCRSFQVPVHGYEGQPMIHATMFSIAEQLKFPFQAYYQH